MNTASISVELRDATDSSAVVSLVGADSASAAALGSELQGPLCAFARTLPSVVAARPAGDERRVEFLITEPCYWTPQLPFLYDLRLRTLDDAGTVREFNRPIGLLRLIAHGRNLRLNGERIVLRGACCKAVEPSQLPAARVAETALLTRYPNDDFFGAAASAGVFLVADATADSGDVLNTLCNLSWQPAIALVLFDGAQICDDSSQAARRMNLRLAQRMRVVDSPSATDVEAAADVVAIELEEGKRPPAWIARVAKPVIAIRRGPAYADFHEARAACDRLQAELAPEFDLAGYFV